MNRKCGSRNCRKIELAIDGLSHSSTRFEEAKETVPQRDECRVHSSLHADNLDVEFQCFAGELVIEIHRDCLFVHLDHPAG